MNLALVKLDKVLFLQSQSWRARLYLKREAPDENMRTQEKRIKEKKLNSIICLIICPFYL